MQPTAEKRPSHELHEGASAEPEPEQPAADEPEQPAEPADVPDRPDRVGGDPEPPADPDDADDADELEPEPEPAPEPPQPSSEKVMRKALQDLDKEGSRHASAVERIMGADFAELRDCPTCDIAGFVFPFFPDAPGSAERREATGAYFGGGEVGYRPHPTEQTCATCDGLGELSNGSRRDGHTLSVCPTCSGTGHTTREGQNQQSQPLSLVPGETTPLPPVQAVDLSPDVWGRPAGHPHFGLVPAMVGSGTDAA